MRKTIYLLITLCIVSVIPIHAQSIVSYGFECKQGTYEEITGGTVVGAGLTGNTLMNIAFDGTDKNISNLQTVDGISFGFNFTFNDIPMNKLVIGSHGYIVLGKDQVKIDPTRGGFMLSDNGEGKNNVIGLGFNANIMGSDTTNISYKVTGNAPDRRLIVQYTNLLIAIDRTGKVKDVDLQICLHETSNKIELIFRNWENSLFYQSGYIGLKGNNGDAHLRYSPMGEWDRTEFTTNRSINWGFGYFPANGLTYTFTIPVACEKPTGQPTELKLSSSATNIEGSFKRTATADHYLIVMSKEQALASTPADKIYYKVGDKIGNGTVIAYDTVQKFKTTESIEGSIPYYFHIYAVNSFCSFGPVYNITNPLTGSSKLLPDKIQNLESKGAEYNFINLSAVGNATNDQILIVTTDETAGASSGRPTGDGVFGTPKGELNVGSVIEGGGKVVYKGEAKSDIKIESLNSHTLYHFKGWSVDSYNNYSTSSVTVNEITWGKLPYEASFTNMPLYNAPFGWETTGDLFRIATKASATGGEELCQLECNIQFGDPATGSEHTTATQWIKLNSRTSRIIFNCNFTTWARVGGTQPYTNWDEKDALEIQVSNNGTDYTTVYTVNKENAPKMNVASDWGTIFVPFDNFKEEKVKIRLKWKTFAPSVKLLIENFTVEEKPACDRPTSLSVDESTIVGNQALIRWIANDDENAWDIRFRKAGEETWSEPMEVRTNPYLLTNLPLSSKIELQIRAKCSLTSFSSWSESLIFNSGHAIPFTENFSSSDIPIGWNLENGILDSPTQFCVELSCIKNWTLIQNSIRVRYSNLRDWIVTPKIDLGDGSFHGKLEFDLTSKLGTKPAADDIYFAVVLSKDGGITFNKEDVVMELKKDDIIAITEGKHYSINLNKYSGIVKIGFYAYSEANGSEQLILDNISLLETCPAVTNAKATEVTSESAVVNWEGDADEWLTFIRKAGENKKDYTKQSQTKLVLAELSPKTKYEVGITKTCAVNDTARVVIVAFTTQSLAPCPIPEGITTTPTKSSVTINWEGEADKYNIRIRQTGAEEWIEKITSVNSIMIDGLEADTEYEFTIQSVCSTAEGDISPWTEVGKVKTLPMTCFAPDFAVSTTHKAATVTWEGEASEYQLAYRTGETAWTLKDVKNSKTLTLDNLTASTKYNLRMRSICSANDSSKWSEISEFTTANIPVCSPPTNLRASGITDTAAKLEWNADEVNLTWDVSYRVGTSTSWETAEKLAQKSYQMDNLIPNTPYLWKVKATCDEDRKSEWSSQETFNTAPSGIRNAGVRNLKVYTVKNIINIQNPAHVKIDRICIYNTNGQIIKEFDINSDENVMIPTRLDTDKVIVKVFGEKITSSYTLILQ